MTFPSNNLPTASRNWAREVEKKVTNLESSFRSAEVNNVTRDSQLSVTANTALNAATQAQQAAGQAQLAIDEILDLGNPGGPSINASNINAGTLTGITVQTGSFGTRSKLSGSNIEFFSSLYNSGVSRVGYIQGDDGGSAGVYIISDQGAIALDAVDITLSGDTTVTGELSVGGSFSPGSISTGGITASSVTVGTSQINSTSVYGESITGDSVGGGFANFTGSVTGQSGVISNSVLTRTQLAGGGTTGASVTDGGNFVRTTSSARYKTDIQDLDVSYDAIMSMQPKTFKRIEEVEENPESARTYPGFIAEDLAGTELDVFTFKSLDENGNPRPEGIHYAELTAALVSALKHQDQLIKDLTARIEALEAK